MNREDAEEFTQSLGQIVAGSWRQIALADDLGVPKALGLTLAQWVDRLGGHVKQDIPERRRAAVELAERGKSSRGIGEILGVSHTTVGRDLAGTNVPPATDDSEQNKELATDAGTNVPSPIDALAALAADEKVRAAVKTAESREAKEAGRNERRAENLRLVESTSNPLIAGARFATVMIDPPWDWGDEGDQDQLGRARPTYATMPFEQILALPVPQLADVDCHLYLWITNRSLPKGFALFDGWGFRYVTCVTWAKPHFGMGNYFRGQTEHVLFGVKGSQPLKRRDVGTLFPAPRGPLGHSSKPQQFYELVESCSPGPYLEMFARSGRANWIPWGAEANAA